MPSYNYKCSCGHLWTELVSFRDSDHVQCPECGNPAPKRMMSAPGLVFKGSGFYINDSRNKSESTVV